MDAAPDERGHAPGVGQTRPSPPEFARTIRRTSIAVLDGEVPSYGSARRNAGEGPPGTAAP
jgi:hypothetical protein